MAPSGSERMLFDVVVTALTGPHARPIMANYLAHEPGVSRESALAMLDNLPVVYRLGVTAEEAAATAARLEKIGAQAAVTPSAGHGHPCASVRPQQAAGRSVRPSPAIAAPARPAPQTLSTGRAGAPDAARPRPGRRTAMRTAGAVVLCAVAVMAGLLLRQFRARAPARAQDVPGRPAPAQAPRAGKAARPPPHEKNRASAYADTAASLEQAIDRIRFYRIALSFNRYNLRAWRGLVTAYEDRAMIDEARKARGEMHAIFGAQALSLEAVAARFGEVEEVERDGDAVRIEYRAAATQRDRLVDEVCRCAVEVSAACGCRTITIYARTPRHGGLIAHVSAPVPPDCARFERRATLTYLK